MGRRDEDERPPIEILGADLGVSSTQQVAMGPRHHGPGRRRALVVAASVVAVLITGLALGGSDDDPQHAPEEERDNSARVGLDKPYTSTTARRTTTTRPTTTTTTVPLGPPLGTPVEGALLLIGPAWWRVVDLTDGSIRDISLPPNVDPYSSLAVAGGIVIPENGEASYYPILAGGEHPEPQPLGPGDIVLTAGSDRVWLVDLPPEGVSDGPASVGVRLVDLTGHVFRSFDVPGRWVEEATADAVIVSRGGRVYAADDRGMRAIAVGWTAGTNGGAAVVLTCDTDASCALRRQPLDGGRAQTLMEVPDPDAGVSASTEAADGRLAMIVADPYGTDAEVLLFGADGSPLGRVAVRADAANSPPQWLPGDLGLVVGSGSGTQWVRPDGGGWSVAPFLLGDQVSEETMIVIQP